MKKFLMMSVLLLAMGSCGQIQNKPVEVSDENTCGLEMSKMYSDAMILQRDVPLKIKGKASPGEVVTVKLEGQSRNIRKRARADSEGVWQVTVSPLKAAEGLTLTITGRDKVLTYNDVAVGDIWVCSGQSNMFFRVFEGVEVDPTPADSGLRLYNMVPKCYVNPERWSDADIESTQKLDFYHPTTWQPCDGENMKPFSAVGYHFGKMLRDSLNVPIGLICNAIGGSPAEAWVDRASLEEGFPEALEDWFDNKIFNQWCKEMGMINLGYPETGATRHPYEPTYLFDAAIGSMEQFQIKGVVWYQGESNDFNIPMHEKLFNLLVNGWRRHFDNPVMPFHFVQLSSYAPGLTWAEFRDSQRKLAEAIPYCEMAVSSDLGDSLDIHPRMKRPVGERLARQALRYDYGFDIVPSGPLFREATIVDSSVVLDFDFAEGLTSSDSQPLKCFEIAADDMIFVPAEAVILDGKVVIMSKIDNPSYVRYAWQPFTRANLVNGEGLPASTFMAKVSK